eukprot:TRINITY_DN953_c0_g1_i1.p1 TRINITY_DN953_c0_g1~~TRINITY_DN953_c0_g1_i1.p1  ORF type:complete len:305 (-),score=42.37 TRINITY_DN953_c0_g1_i1:259-1173(-)
MQQVHESSPSKYLISTIDFFFPLVNDPFLQGEIACANVLSDLYAVGSTKCDHILMVLGVAIGMNETEKEISTRELIKGFDSKAQEAGTQIKGGQTIFNPFPMIGGVANAVVKEQEFIEPKQGKEGDVLVLTKPLGSRIAVNAYQWMMLNNKHWKKIEGLVSVSEVQYLYDICAESLRTLNLKAARLMHKHRAHGCTDVTGFGILGHAQNLAEVQQKEVDLVINRLPIFAHAMKIQDKAIDYKMLEGKTAETSGGLLVMLPSETADQYIIDLEQEGILSWKIGKVIKGSRTARLQQNPEILEVFQ